MTKTIADYLPKKDEDKVLVQVKIPESMHHEVDKIRKKDGVTWHELVKACFERYLDEAKPSKRQKSS